MEAMRAAIAQLVYLSPTRHLMYITRTLDGNPTGTMQHLTCFFPGLLALGNYLLPDSVYKPGEKQVFEYVAEGLANTCYILYADSLTGLGPEEVQFQPYNGVDNYESSRWIHHLQKWEKRTSRKSSKPPGLQTPVPYRRDNADSRHKDYYYTELSWLCRPQARDHIYIFQPTNLLHLQVVESMYLMWRTTGNPIWRKRAWEIFQAIEKNAKVNGGAYAVVMDVDGPEAMHDDEQPRSVHCSFHS
jgi:mannosyl-oligosaccharide alpha-1,2-mannosidase